MAQTIAVLDQSRQAGVTANVAFDERGAIAHLGKISSDDYRTVLDAMARYGDGWVARKKIVNDSGVMPTIVSNALNALKGRGIILSDSSRQGYYKLPTKSFAAWINAIKSVEERKGSDLQLHLTDGAK